MEVDERSVTEQYGVRVGCAWCKPGNEEKTLCSLRANQFQSKNEIKTTSKALNLFMGHGETLHF